MNDLIDNNSKENIESTISEKQNESLKIKHIPIHDGTCVEDSFFNQVLQQIRDIESALEPEQSYKAKTLCGKEFWNSLEKSERIRAGKCVVDMVRKNLLPLCFAGTTKANSQLYQLK